MIGKRNMAAITLVMAGFIVSGFLLSGCKKPPPEGTASAPTQQSTSASNVGREADAIPQEALQHVRLGLERVHSKDYDSAISEYNMVIEKYPKYVMAYNDRAAVYVKQGKFDKAREDLDKALAIDPHNPATYYNTAALYSLQNESSQALDYLEKALVLGFKDYDLLRSDPDLKNIRKNPKFREILKKQGVSVPK